MTEREIRGKTFLITGAAVGLGAAFAEAFLKEGAKHVALLDISEELGRATESKLRRVYGAEAAWFTSCDVSSEEQLTGAYAAALDKFRRIDVVINNAGIAHEDEPMQMIQINLLGLVSSSYKALEAMRVDRGGAGGTIINICSTASLAIHHVLPVYCATKSAVLSFSNCIGMEERYKETKVRVLAICFGATATTILDKIPQRAYDPEMARDAVVLISSFPVQSVETAAAGMIEAFRRGDSGSTWISRNDEPVRGCSRHRQLHLNKYFLRKPIAGGGTVKINYFVLV